MPNKREGGDTARAVAGLRHELPRRVAEAKADPSLALRLDKALDRLGKAALLDEAGDTPGIRCHGLDILDFDPGRDAVTPGQADALMLLLEVVDQARDTCRDVTGWDALEDLGAVSRGADGRWLAVTKSGGRALAETFRSASCAANLCSNVYTRDVGRDVKRFHMLDEWLFGAAPASPSRGIEAMGDLVTKGLAWNPGAGVGIVASFLDHDGFVCATMPQVVTPDAVTSNIMDHIPDRPQDFDLWDFMQGAPSVCISRECLKVDMGLLANGLCREGWATYSRYEDIALDAMAAHLARVAPDDLASRLERARGDGPAGREGRAAPCIDVDR